MILGQQRVTLFLGHFGSGKTEAAVNFAIHLARDLSMAGVSLADLDLVNPYFRSREARDALESFGVSLVLPDEQYLEADLPILVPQVRASLVASTGPVVLDVGGDDVGARVLGSLHDALPAGSYRALMVVNANRPFTRDVAGVARMKREIETAGDVQVTGLVSNTHLIGETTVETVMAGLALGLATGRECGLPLEFVCVPEGMVDAVRSQVEVEVLPMRRYLSFPWDRAAARPAVSGKDLFRL
jgi:hypothetical protein